MKNDLKIREGEEKFLHGALYAVQAQIKLLSMKIYEALQSSVAVSRESAGKLFRPRIICMIICFLLKPQMSVDSC